RSQAYPVLNNLGVPQHWLHLGTSGEDLGRDGFVGLQRPIPRQGHATQYNGLTVWVDVALFRRRAGDLGEQLGKSRILDDDDLPSDRYHLPVWHKLSRPGPGAIHDNGRGASSRCYGTDVPDLGLDARIGDTSLHVTQIHGHVEQRCCDPPASCEAGRQFAVFARMERTDRWPLW